MRRAFIVGNGPSLAQTNLDLLKNEVTFGVNQCHLIYPTTTWRPTYWVCTERDLRMEIVDWASLFYLHYSLGETCYIAKRHLTRLEALGNNKQTNPYMQQDWWPGHWQWGVVPDDRLNILNMCSHHGTRIGKDEWWPKEWHLPQVCLFAGSVLTSIQLAVTMGYDDLAVVGCDVSYDPWKNNHFSEDYFVFRPYDEEWAEYLAKAQVYAHELAAKECAALGIPIVNAGVGGRLEAYPRCELGSLVTAQA